MAHVVEASSSPGAAGAYRTHRQQQAIKRCAMRASSCCHAQCTAFGVWGFPGMLWQGAVAMPAAGMAGKGAREAVGQLWLCWLGKGNTASALQHSSWIWRLGSLGVCIYTLQSRQGWGRDGAGVGVGVSAAACSAISGTCMPCVVAWMHGRDLPQRSSCASEANAQ